MGVLALQGGFEAHERVLRRLGARTREVRTPADLNGLDGLVIPGGESTTMTIGIQREKLAEPLRALVRGGASGDGACVRRAPGGGGRTGGEGRRGIPVLGSCAGLIMLDREHLGLMDMRAQRNAFGRQLHSFETDLDIRGLDGLDRGAGAGGRGGRPLRAVFIRAPWIAEHGPDVEILAQVDGHPVAARQDGMLAVAFHAELTGDDRLHRMFLQML